MEFSSEDFADARFRMRQARALRSAEDRDAALSALDQARVEFTAAAAATYEAGAQAARADCDRIEGIAARLLEFVDSIESAFERMEVAREIDCQAGARALRMQRSVWSRATLATTLCESFEPLLSASAARVLTAAVRLEASR